MCETRCARRARLWWPPVRIRAVHIRLLPNAGDQECGVSCAVARPGRDSRAATLGARARQRQHVVDAPVEDEILVQDAQHFLTAAADRIEEGPARPAPHQGDL